jgi:hypothetical protein
MAKSQILAADLVRIEDDAKEICDWGGVPQPDYSIAWQVFRDAITGTNYGAKMNSGWTKAASFATDGLVGKEQTIWDSRVASSIIWRIDQILKQSNMPLAEALALVKSFALGGIPSRNVGTRPRACHFEWPSGYGQWRFHFSGSSVVREIVDILNDPKNAYPRMPVPILDSEGHQVEMNNQNWNVFGVGLVLFMDGW